MNNLVLIGMPGAGKSTLGGKLASRLGWSFVDTDLLIREAQGEELHQIIAGTGYLTFRRIEEEALVSLDYQSHVIATGGSAVHSRSGMANLKRLGKVVFLDVPADTLLARIGDFRDRGIASAPDKSFYQIYKERTPLYLEYADAILDCDNLTKNQVLDELENICRDIER